MNNGLKIESVYSTKNPSFVKWNGDLQSVLQAHLKPQDYKVVAFCMDKVMLGYINAGCCNIVFPAGNELNEKYLLELHVFNGEQELLVRKTNGMLKVRNIVDSTTENDNEKIDCVDDCSKIFGCPVEFRDGFVTLVEAERKFSLMVPAYKQADCFLVTRSYIVSDEATGLSGYGYYRYLDITE